MINCFQNFVNFDCFGYSCTVRPCGTAVRCKLGDRVTFNVSYLPFTMGTHSARITFEARPASHVLPYFFLFFSQLSSKPVVAGCRRLSSFIAVCPKTH